MSCPLTCAANAVCTILTQGFTCVCNEGFVGNGYSECKRETFNADSIYLYVIILIALLFVGLIAVVVYFLCRRRILEVDDKEPLAISVDDQYDRKWELILQDQYIPPDYDEIKDQIEPAQATTFFMETQVSPAVEEDERVIVEGDVQGEDEVDVAEVAVGFDNPTYDTVEIDEKDGGEDLYDNPPVIKDGSLSGSDSIPESITVVNTLPEPEVEVVTEAEVPVVEAAPEVEAEVEVAAPGVEAVVAQPETVKISFEEHEDAPNTITATVTTPNANLTINLNIKVPGEEEEVVE